MTVRQPKKRPAFVSSQVTEAHRYYLDLAPSARAGLVVVCGGWERMRADYLVERETFPYRCIEFVAEGAGTLILAGRESALVPGSVFAYAPGVAHVIRSDPRRPMRKYYVDFTGREAAGALAATPLGGWEPGRVAAPQEIQATFDALQRDALMADDLAEELCTAHLRVLLLQLRRRVLLAGEVEPRALASYERARRCIEEHFASLQTAEDVARRCHMTPVHLSRLFRRFNGDTPYHALMRRKMNRAAELLLDGKQLVKEAAEALGFSSQFQFSRVFKRIYGIAPDHFVRTHPRGRLVGGG